VKIRLYRGPFDGKILNQTAGTSLYMAGPKKMSRKQKYEWAAKQYKDSSQRWNHFAPAYPIVEAEYRLVHGCRHPDGSYFYEWTGKKREQ
jgi:hypothetical protein